MPPISTIETALTLQDRATPSIRRIRNEMGQLEIVARRAGDAMDSLSGPKEAADLEALARETRGVGQAVQTLKREATTAAPSLRLLGTELKGVGRSARDARVEVDRLHGALMRLRGVDARAQVHVGGVAASRAEVGALRSDLRSYGRQSPVAGVGAGALSGGGGSGLGGRVLTGIPGGGGGAGIGLALAALPLVQSVGGAAGALGASAAGAALGAGAVGAAGVGATALGLGAIASIAMPAKQGLQQVAQAQKTLNQATAEYGRNSEQAARARLKLDMAARAAPAGTAGLYRQATGLQRDWRRLTRPGQSALLGGAAGGIRQVRGVAPTLAGQANTIGQAAGAQLGQFAGFATAPTQMLAVRDLSGAFASNLDEAERTGEHLVSTFANIARASIPFFHQGMVWLDHWTAGWARSTSDITATRSTIGRYVGDLREFGHVAGDAGKLVRDLFAPGESEGHDLLGRFDQTLQTWDAWAQRNPGRLRAFFHQSADDVGQMAHFLGIAVRDINRLATALGPVFRMFLALANIGGGAGLLLPGALRAGAGRLFGSGGGGAAAGGGAGGGLLPVAVGGGARGVTAAEAGGVGYLAARTAGGGLATPERFTGAYGGVAGARYGAPVSQLGARATLAGRARGALSGAGRFAGGLLAVQGVLGGITTQGGPFTRVTGGLNAATFGLFPTEYSGGQYRQQGASQALGALQSAGIVSPFGGITGQTPAQIRRQIQQTQQRLGTQQQRLQDAVAGPLEQPVSALWGHGKPIRGEVHGQIGALEDALRKENKALADAMRQRNQILDEKSREQGDTLAVSFQKGFDIERRHGVGPEAAMQDAIDGMLKKLGHMRPAGAEVLGDDMLGWAKTMAKHNPKLRGVVDDLADAIEKRFRQLGKRVKVVNDTILTGSKSQWKEIETALEDPAEQAREKVSAAFTGIQREAVGAMELMGFSRAEAREAVKNVEQGVPVGAARGLAASGARYTGLAKTYGKTPGGGDGPGAGPPRPARSGDGPGGLPPLTVNPPDMSYSLSTTTVNAPRVTASSSVRVPPPSAPPASGGTTVHAHITVSPDFAGKHATKVIDRHLQVFAERVHEQVRSGDAELDDPLS
jgi:hypothetical protein